MEISVIFPCYNEEKILEDTMLRAVEALRAQFETFEILLIEDASRDRSPEICDRLAEQYPEIRVLHNPKNMGQGASIVRGFQNARYKLLLHNGMDYPFDLADLRLMVPLLKDADIVVAARRARAGYSPYRVLTSIVHGWLLRHLFPLHLSDYGFVQLYPRSVWQDVKVEARSTAFMVPEALIRAYDMGYRIKEVKITYHARTAGVATSGKPKVIIACLREMARFWWKRLLRRTPRAAVAR